jgi:predicted dehydrogenase/nucleoside-diphosphate-sugar epimerase
LNLPSTPHGRALRAGIIGTGFIADFHARGIANVENTQLAAVCDSNAVAAAAFAAQWNVPAFSSLDTLLEQGRLDTLHVLTPPDTHHAIAKRALESGIHVLLEKPMCASVEECADLVALAGQHGRTLGVSHSFVFEGAFTRLRDAVRAGELGPLDHVTINIFMELGFIRFGPFTSWMLREPKNALFELGPHPVSAIVDLLGVPDELHVTADRDVVVPGGARVYRRWRIQGDVGRTAFDINMDLGPGFQQRTIAVRGLAGAALADLDANTCVIDRQTPAAVDFDRRQRSLSQAAQLRAQANATLRDYVLNKAKLTKRGAPFANSLGDSIAAFYSGVSAGDALDPRISGTFGQAVMETCERIAVEAKLKQGARSQISIAPAVSKPSVLVLGATGFIGKHLIRQLLDQGYHVRAAARGSGVVFEDVANERLQVLRTDIRSANDIDAAIDGVECVYHLATSDAKTWDQYREREIEPTVQLARACLDRGVQRLIYTGTIDSYFAGRRGDVITERTPLDPNIGRRNYYARAKAEAERQLEELHRTQGLPLVIVRPGIVIGRGGNPFHWGVGKWAGPTVVQTWGDGDNPLPLVLVDDVARALVLAMETPGIEGRSFNLIDLPLLTARDYIAAMERLAGLRIDVHPTPSWKSFAGDFAKWPVKRAVGHADGVRIPSYRDWLSRTQRAVFDCTRAREELKWTPISNAEKMVSEGIAGSLASWLKARE